MNGLAMLPIIMKLHTLPICLALAASLAAHAEIKVIIDHNDNDNATERFRFPHVPPPSADAAAVQFQIIDGTADENSGGVEKLNDGKGPTEDDQPGENFFFEAGTEGGRLLLDLNKAAPIHQVNTYSWHPGSRGPQVYKLYGATGDGAGFDAKPGHGIDPEKAAWKLIAKVDTRPAEGEGGGQYGVSIRDSDGPLGNYRYLLFDCAATETSDAFGNTFYSEIDVLTHAPAAGSSGTSETAISNAVAAPYVAHSADGRYEITFDYKGAPDLGEWVTNKLAPVLAEWYPKIVAYLPSDGYEAPKKFTVTLKPGRGVAATGGTRVTANSSWVRKQEGDAVGALVHECVHVVQQYGRGRRNNPNRTQNPGWLTEGIADYYRFYKFEPQTHGAEITKKGLARAHYDAAYRPTANFLNWVSGKYDPDLVPQLNAAMRQGNYSTNLWIEHTGKPVQQLGDDWLAELKKNLDSAKQD
jgi:hypothetical protein